MSAVVNRPVISCGNAESGPVSSLHFDWCRISTRVKIFQCKRQSTPVSTILHFMERNQVAKTRSPAALKVLNSPLVLVETRLRLMAFLVSQASD
jgi:hypothetical protein